MPPSVVKILLVEDSLSDAVLLEESLMQNELGQFKLTHVETLADAMKQVQAASFDVLLLDLTLPDSTGRETFLSARRAELPLCPSWVITSFGDEAVGLDAVRHGIQDYLIKGQAYGRQVARAIRYAIQRKQAEDNSNLPGDPKPRATNSNCASRNAPPPSSAANQALQTEIFQRQQAETAHQQVLRRLSRAEETERGRISRELHDQLGDSLTALKLGLQMLRSIAPWRRRYRKASAGWSS